MIAAIIRCQMCTILEEYLKNRLLKNVLCFEEACLSFHICVINISPNLAGPSIFHFFLTRILISKMVLSKPEMELIISLKALCRKDAHFST